MGRALVRMAKIRNLYNILGAKLEDKTPPGRPRRRWKITIEWILEKYIWKLWTRLSGSGQGQVAGSCEHGMNYRVP
jgi:hypothetical protein